MTSTNMVCTICRVTIDQCRCPDADERWRSVAYDPDACVILKWCRTCDKHFARCRCAVPAYYIICGGQEVDPATLRDMHGRQPAIDLSPFSEREN